MLANGEARERGYDQVLWLLDGKVTEAGASNFFVVWKTPEGKTQLVTAPLDDKIILDGVTRRSILQLARERLTDGTSSLPAIEIVERNFTMDEVRAAVSEGRIIEAFAAGTAVSHCACFIQKFPSLTLKPVLRIRCFRHQLQRARPPDSNGPRRDGRVRITHQKLVGQHHVRKGAARVGCCR